ncbi:response regulator transcription factor [Pseudonocardia sp. RS010]|uniref:response regulator transcription factor n=1 Tax=Pseudonocardia sp. RS010 TaxID=3385979 RepID=UPI0039A01644
MPEKGSPQHSGGDFAWLISALRRIGSLSDRQREVLLLLAGGRDTRSIGKALRISEHTVKVHTSALMRALGVRSRLQAGIAGFAYLTATPSGSQPSFLHSTSPIGAPAAGAPDGLPITGSLLADPSPETIPAGPQPLTNTDDTWENSCTPSRLSGAAPPPSRHL